jgi:hypothetical protein
MPTLETPLTELDAVNVMLSAIGEAPVSTLDEGSVLEATIARSVLKDTSHLVQEKSWAFNTEANYPLVPDVNGKITLPLNFVRVRQDKDNDSSDYDLVQRGTQLYDRKNHTDVFTQTVKAIVTMLLPFDSMPPVARRFVTLKAARLFQSRMVGSDTLHAFTEEDEKEAQSDFEEAEGDTTGYTIFDNYTVYRSLDRQN